MKNTSYNIQDCSLGLKIMSKMIHTYGLEIYIKMINFQDLTLKITVLDIGLYN